MAALSPLQQEIFDMHNGRFMVVTMVQVTSGSDTLALPEGLGSSTKHVTVVPIDSSHTAKTVSTITQNAHPEGASVALTGGTSGSMQFVISLHNGNAAGL